MNDWILVVDDDTSNLKIASHILGKAQMRVSCLKSGEEAVKFLEENRPDLILLDIHMPVMDGFETMLAICKNKAAASIPVIFLTADDDSNTEGYLYEWSFSESGGIFQRNCTPHGAFEGNTG